MEQLLKITTVPIQIDIKVNHAKLEYTRGTADLQISRDEGGLNIQSKPIRLRLDTFEARNSVSPTPMRSIEQAAQKGRQAVYDAMSTAAQQGKLLLQTKVGEELITQFAKESTYINTDFQMGWLPSTGPDISWDKGEISIRYEMDKLNFDWNINKGNYHFTPGSIEISVAQKPDVIIEYVGGPLYVPPSSDPNYEPIDVNA
nr:DUF6470 family protein [uncultured Butyricicoccus sp.]